MQSERQLVEDFESCRIAAGGFGHSDHVRVAWQMLEEGSLEEALPRFTRAIRRFAEHHGAGGLYHQTITWTYFFVINERRSQLPEEHSWPAFAAANPDLFENHRLFLGRYYSEEVLGSDFARQQYALPNRSLTDSRAADSNTASAAAS